MKSVTTPTGASPASVVKVGAGRGFIIEHRTLLRPWRPPRGFTIARFKYHRHRFIITAAHCLPTLPLSRANTAEWEWTYKGLLGSIDGSKKDVWAECLFVDPVADIAVLCEPDGQRWCEMGLDDVSDKYFALVNAAQPLRIGKPRSGKGWVL